MRVSSPMLQLVSLASAGQTCEVVRARSAVQCARPMRACHAPQRQMSAPSPDMRRARGSARPQPPPGGLISRLIKKPAYSAPRRGVKAHGWSLHGPPACLRPGSAANVQSRISSLLGCSVRVGERAQGGLACRFGATPSECNAYYSMQAHSPGVIVQISPIDVPHTAVLRTGVQGGVHAPAWANTSSSVRIDGPVVSTAVNKEKR